MANFCKYCGKALQDGEICSCPQAQAEAAAPGQPQYKPPQPPQPPQPQYQPPQQQYQQPASAPNASDHTAEFDPKDISDNKLFASLGYLFGIIGIIVMMLINPSSPFVRFHMREAVKFAVADGLVAIATVVLSIIIIGALLGPIAMLVLYVIKIICIFQTLSGKAKEAPLLSSISFLK